MNKFDMDTQGISDRLRKVIKKLNIRNSVIIKTCELDKSVISFVLSQQRTPSASMLYRISKEYNISIDWLLHGRGNMFMYPQEHPINNLSEDYIGLITALERLDDDKKAELLNLFRAQVQLLKK